MPYMRNLADLNRFLECGDYVIDYTDAWSGLICNVNINSAC